MKALLVITFFSCWCFASVGSAQEEGGERSFRVLGYGNGTFQGISFERPGEEETEPVLLEFVPDRESRPLRIGESQNRIRFFREGLSSRGKAVRVELGSVFWPKDAERVLVVFLEKEGTNGGEPVYELLVLDESPAVWGPRCVRFLNLSGVPLDAKMQQFAFPVEQGPTDILCFEGEYSVPMTLELSLPWRGRRQIVYSARFVADQYSPKLLVIKPPAEEGSLKVVVDTIW